MGHSIRLSKTIGMMNGGRWWSALGCLLIPLHGVAGTACHVQSGALATPVLELYTSQGCSSCPPAELWLSGLKGKPVVAQAFHVNYWDYIGWTDHLAQPAFTARQKELAQRNGLHGIYTPQLVRNGRDWRDYAHALDSSSPARAGIALGSGGQANLFDANVTPKDAEVHWSGYWTMTEDGYSTHINAGENAGEFLTQDFVVRELVPLAQYQGAQSLQFMALPSRPEHLRRINLVVTDAKTQDVLQAVSMVCM